MLPVFEKTLPPSVCSHTHAHTHTLSLSLSLSLSQNNTPPTHTVCMCVSLTIDRSERNFFFRNDLKLDFSDSKQVCDIIVNNLFMRGITQIGIIMTATANHTLYSIAFARADLVPL